MDQQHFNVLILLNKIFAYLQFLVAGVAQIALEPSISLVPELVIMFFRIHKTHQVMDRFKALGIHSILLLAKFQSLVSAQPLFSHLPIIMIHS